MSSFVHILALVPLALAASMIRMVPNQAMIFKEHDFAMNAGRKGVLIASDGNCMNLDSISDYISRMNVGSIYVPCPSEVKQDMMCSMYSDNSCNNELFTFTRPHANLFRPTVGDGVGRHVRSIKCATVYSPADRQGHVFSSDHASTKSPSNCPNDSCSNELDCQSNHPDYDVAKEIAGVLGANVQVESVWLSQKTRVVCRALSVLLACGVVLLGF
ncbi:uncharacterized protein N7518_003961 [Penicillium psychrosexuale]|uniref:uncharacterized protein n=1 Tax=Penicillium psychrosexuale TaxID=1002107 RepID=UPI0025457B55|nr:uncharacterized protein N7518_003961 [Penicillium psychrosexuale]KAJ5795421.1 hypothetical protein N7518_003961 [Penicillium psychrosexuale]